PAEAVGGRSLPEHRGHPGQCHTSAGSDRPGQRGGHQQPFRKPAAEQRPDDHPCCPRSDSTEHPPGPEPSTCSAKTTSATTARLAKATSTPTIRTSVPASVSARRELNPAR